MKEEGRSSQPASKLKPLTAGNVLSSKTSVTGYLLLLPRSSNYTFNTQIINFNKMSKCNVDPDFSGRKLPFIFLLFDFSFLSFADLRYVNLKIFDILGKEITNLVSEKLKPGTYEAQWDGGNHSSGTYFYKLIVDNKLIDTKKLILKK